MLVYWLYNLYREFPIKCIIQALLVSSYKNVLYNDAFKVIAQFKKKQRNKKKYVGTV